jgi:lipopolysaccharide biosynthesis glycosyltransferase
MQKNPVAVFCFDKSFRYYAAVSTYSLFKSAINGIRVYWFIPEEDRSEISPVVDMLNKTVRADIRMVSVAQEAFSDWKNPHYGSRHLTRAALFRLLIPQFIQEDRVVYLDADTLVLSDIRELYSMEMGNNVFAGVLDITEGSSSMIPRDSSDRYINSGVLLWDLAALRRDDFVNKAMDIYDKFRDQIVWADQCIINKYAENRKLLISPRWNLQILSNGIKGSQFIDMLSTEQVSIIHFLGAIKPWQRWCNPVIAEFWWKYANQLQIEGLAPQEITTIDQALILAGSLDANEMYKESSQLKGNVIGTLIDVLNKKT